MAGDRDTDTEIDVDWQVIGMGASRASEKGFCVAGDRNTDKEIDFDWQVIRMGANSCFLQKLCVL